MCLSGGGIQPKRAFVGMVRKTRLSLNLGSSHTQLCIPPFQGLHMALHQYFHVCLMYLLTGKFLTRKFLGSKSQDIYVEEKEWIYIFQQLENLSLINYAYCFGYFFAMIVLDEF